MKLGIRKIIIASSETTYGVCFAEGDKDSTFFPLEEDYDIDPMDSYGLSKLVNEKTARAFAMRSGADIYALRIGNVIEPHEYGRFPASSPIPYPASAMPGAISTLAISGRSSIFASRKTVSASRSSTPSTTRSRPMMPTADFLKRSVPDAPSRPRTRPGEAPCRTARSARFWGSSRSTTGANT